MPAPDVRPFHQTTTKDLPAAFDWNRPASAHASFSETTTKNLPPGVFVCESDKLASASGVLSFVLLLSSALFGIPWVMIYTGKWDNGKPDSTTAALWIVGAMVGFMLFVFVVTTITWIQRVLQKRPYSYLYSDSPSTQLGGRLSGAIHLSERLSKAKPLASDSLVHVHLVCVLQYHRTTGPSGNRKREETARDLWARTIDTEARFPERDRCVINFDIAVPDDQPPTASGDSSIAALRKDEWQNTAFPGRVDNDWKLYGIEWQVRLHLSSGINRDLPLSRFVVPVEAPQAST